MADMVRCLLMWDVEHDYLGPVERDNNWDQATCKLAEMSLYVTAEGES